MLLDERGVENRGYESTVTGASCSESEARLCSEFGRGCWVQVEQNNRGHFPNEYNKDSVSLTGPPQVRHPLCRFKKKNNKTLTEEKRGSRRRIKETEDRREMRSERRDGRMAMRADGGVYRCLQTKTKAARQKEEKLPHLMTHIILYIYIYFLFVGCFSCFPPTKEKTYHRSFSPFICLNTSFNATVSEKKNQHIGLKVAGRETWVFLLNHTNILRVRI